MPEALYRLKPLDWTTTSDGTHSVADSPLGEFQVHCPARGDGFWRLFHNEDCLSPKCPCLSLSHGQRMAEEAHRAAILTAFDAV